MFWPDKVFVGGGGSYMAGKSRELGTLGLARQLSCKPFFPAGENTLLAMLVEECSARRTLTSLW